MNIELVAQMFKNYQSNVLFHLEGKYELNLVNKTPANEMGRVISNRQFEGPSMSLASGVGDVCLVVLVLGLDVDCLYWSHVYTTYPGENMFFLLRDSSWDGFDQVWWMKMYPHRMLFEGALPARALAPGAPHCVLPQFHCARAVRRDPRAPAPARAAANGKLKAATTTCTAQFLALITPKPRFINDSRDHATATRMRPSMSQY